MAVRLWVIRDAALARRTAYRLPYVKYSTGANRTIRTVCRALGKPDSTAARRAFLFAQTNDEWQAELIRFYGASALFRVQRLFSPHSFLARQKRMGRRRHTAPFRRRKDMARGAAAAVPQTAPCLRRVQMRLRRHPAQQKEIPHIRADKRERRRKNEKVLW